MRVCGRAQIGVLIILGELFVEEAVRKLVVGVSYSSDSNVECSVILSLMSCRAQKEQMRMLQPTARK
jgi:hypothetical protein